MRQVFRAGLPQIFCFDSTFFYHGKTQAVSGEKSGRRRAHVQQGGGDCCRSTKRERKRRSNELGTQVVSDTRPVHDDISTMPVMMAMMSIVHNP
jgi:hypothetical protein